MKEVWKRDSEKDRRVLSGMRWLPSEGIMRFRRETKDWISKSWSLLIVARSVTVLQSAAMIPFAISIIEAHIRRRFSSETLASVIFGRVASSMAIAVLVARRHGAMLLVLVLKPYFNVIGIERAVNDLVTAPLAYISGSAAWAVISDSNNAIDSLDRAM